MSARVRRTGSGWSGGGSAGVWGCVPPRVCEEGVEGGRAIQCVFAGDSCIPDHHPPAEIQHGHQPARSP